MTNSISEQAIPNRPHCKLFALNTLAAGLCLTGALLVTETAQAANSARVQWATNGHYYQLFEGTPITWTNAKTACAGISAQLATITSGTENAFILSQLLAGRFSWYAIGGTSKDSYIWSWITGEAYSYQNFSASGGGYPQHNGGQDYLAITADTRVNNNSGWGGYAGQWFNVYASDTLTGYICEWSTQNYIDTTMVPDMNGNGIDEVAVLLVDYKTSQHVVNIKDPSTGALLKSLVFATNLFPPFGLVALKDTDGNGAPEIGVLFVQYNFPNVQIKDTKSGATLRNINFMTPGYTPKSVGISPNTNLSGVNDIVVEGINKATGAAQTEIRDSKTGNKSYAVGF